MKTLRRKRKGASGAFLWDPARYWRHHLRPTFAGRPAPTGEELHLVSVGTGLPAMGGGKQVIPQANSRQQGKSCILSLWELACKRRVAQNGHHRRRIFAGRPAPTGEELHLVSVGACLQAMGGAPRALPQANIRRQAGSYKARGGWRAWAAERCATKRRLVALIPPA
jgi:hypothetical protein